MLARERGRRGGDVRERIVCRQIFENVRGGLLTLSELLKIFETTYLGKGSDCRNANEWLFIIDKVPEKDHVLKFTKLGDYLCNKAYAAVTTVMPF